MSLISEALKKAQAQWGPQMPETPRASLRSILGPVAAASSARRWMILLPLPALLVILGAGFFVFIGEGSRTATPIAPERPAAVAHTMKPSVEEQPLVIQGSPHDAEEPFMWEGDLPAEAPVSEAISAGPDVARGIPEQPPLDLIPTIPAPEERLPRVVPTVDVDGASTGGDEIAGEITMTLRDPPAVAAQVPAAPRPERIIDRKQRATSLFEQGVSFQREGEFLRAMDSYGESIRLDPSNVSAHNNLGTVQRRLGDLSAAVKSYRHALWLDPKFQEARMNLATALVSDGRLEDAADELREVLERAPDMLQAYASLGVIYTRLDRVPEAIQALRKALSLDPAHPEAHYNLAVLLERREMLEEAIWHFQQFVDVSFGQYPEVRGTVQAHLEQLRREGVARR